MDIKISIKSMGILFGIPILINDIIIPFLILLISINGSDYNLDQGVYMITQMFTPFLACFWTYLHLSKYIDTKGNESFYIVHRNKWGEVLKLYILYIVTNTPFFIWYVSINQKYALEWVHIAIMSFVFVTAAYFFCYLFKSISLALIPTFIYLIASITELNQFFSKFSFYAYNGMTKAQLFSKYKYFLIAAILFAVLGNLLNKRYDDYNL